MPEIKQYESAFLKELLMKMIRIRRFEDKASQMYGVRKIGGFLHLYIGQEAVAVGSIAAVDLSKDYVLTAYRDHGHALTCGMDPGAVMAELYGRASGCSKGKGGSMHMFDARGHFFGGNGIVGAHIPVATGVALAIRYRKEEGVVLCYFGDGAIHQGTFHESLNMARIWNLPIVYICENNQYGMGTSFTRVSAVTDFSLLGSGYGITGRKADGMDVLDVYEVVRECVAEARKGNPALIEAKTYRYKGHSASDPAKYRTREELEHYRQSDPILILRGAMTEKGVISDTEFESMEEQAKEQARKAVDFADASPEPAMEELYNDMYA